MTVSLAQFEAVNEAHTALIRMGEFIECADQRRYIRQSNVLLDACIDAGMHYDEADHLVWAAKFIHDCLLDGIRVTDDMVFEDDGDFEDDRAWNAGRCLDIAA